MKHFAIGIAFSAALLTAAGCAHGQNDRQAGERARPHQAKNVVLLIGDGMGQNHASATAYALYGTKLDEDGNPPRLTWEHFPVLGLVTNMPTNGFVTDSAASGTALACGEKTYNSAIGMAEDAETPLKSIADIAHERGKAVGIISSVPLNHATPAAFYAKAKSRNEYDNIAKQAFETKNADVILGGALKRQELTEDQLVEMATENGKLLFSLGNLDQLTPEFVGERQVVGYFSADKDDKLTHDRSILTTEGEPSLEELALRTLALIGRDPDGFFLMVEGGAIDWAAHGNNIDDMINETKEFDLAVAAVLAWLEENDQLEDTLVIVTADHETGGLTITGAYDKPFDPATSAEAYSWSTKGHTAACIPVWARGPGARRLAGKIDQTRVFDVMKGQVAPESRKGAKK
ncbi:MAG: alkaline phosphatase [Candidatus Sumerlaeota bacterium]|nr:alkaline phosphatase [Candidatus Sumerlaeota bacterium]